MSRFQTWLWNKLHTMPKRLWFVYLNGSYASIELDFGLFSVFLFHQPWVETKRRFTWWGVE